LPQKGPPRIRCDDKGKDHMSQFPVSVLDLIVIGIVLLSALLASVRGFTREVLAIASWVIAAFVAYAFHPAVLPYFTPHIANPQIALAATIAVLFLGVLVLVSLITVKISDLILDSRIGALDRSLGFLFGAFRGFLIAAIAFMFFDKLVGEKQHPDWVREAKLRPILQEAGNQLLAMLPTDPNFLNSLKPALPPAPDTPGVEPKKPEPNATPTP
jgi:membrane protein required for colicin V production